MQFYSTNRQCREVSLREAVMTGLAPDGGLFMPERIPVIPGAFFNNIADMTIRDISYVVADIMLGDDIDSADIKRIIDETFTFDIPMSSSSSMARHWHSRMSGHGSWPASSATILTGCPTE